MYYDFGHEIRLDTLALISSTNESLAYVLNRSEDPETRKFAGAMMDTSNDIKRFMRDKLTGIERDLYLLKAEGDYIPPTQTK